MNEYLIQKETLTDLADEIRVLSGATDAIGLAAMKTNIADANTEVSSQATTIAEISALLDGKSVPGGGSGGSGGSVETCTVEFVVNNGYPNGVIYASASSVDGFIEWHPEIPGDLISPFEILNGSFFFIEAGFPIVSISGGKLVANLGNGNLLVLANPGAGGTCTITT